MLTGIEKPFNGTNFQALVRSVNRLAAATKVESNRRAAAKKRALAAEQAARLKLREMREEEAAVRGLLFKISKAQTAVANAARNPTPKNARSAQRALNAVAAFVPTAEQIAAAERVPTGYVRKGRFNVQK